MSGDGSRLLRLWEMSRQQSPSEASCKTRSTQILALPGERLQWWAWLQPPLSGSLPPALLPLAASAWNTWRRNTRRPPWGGRQMSELCPSVCPSSLGKTAPVSICPCELGGMWLTSALGESFINGSSPIYECMKTLLWTKYYTSRPGSSSAQTQVCSLPSCGLSSKGKARYE